MQYHAVLGSVRLAKSYARENTPTCLAVESRELLPPFLLGMTNDDDSDDDDHHDRDDHDDHESDGNDDGEEDNNRDDDNNDGEKTQGKKNTCVNTQIS